MRVGIVVWAVLEPLYRVVHVFGLGFWPWFWGSGVTFSLEGVGPGEWN